MAYGGSQARGCTGAAAAALYHSHSHGGSEMCLQSTPQLMTMPDPPQLSGTRDRTLSLRTPVRFITTEPQWELLLPSFLCEDKIELFY